MVPLKCNQLLLRDHLIMITSLRAKLYPGLHIYIGTFISLYLHQLYDESTFISLYLHQLYDESTFISFYLHQLSFL